MEKHFDMKVLFEGKGCVEIPMNINNYAHAIFTKVTIDYLPENNVRLLIPAEEEIQVANFQDFVRNLIMKIGEENSALAQKLARYYKIKL